MDAVGARLEAGREAYGDRSFSLPPGRLAGEVEEELLDVAAWAFILWTRVRGLRVMLTAERSETHER
jgi:hypothetical protein